MRVDANFPTTENEKLQIISVSVKFAWHGYFLPGTEPGDLWFILPKSIVF